MWLFHILFFFFFGLTLSLQSPHIWHDLIPLLYEIVSLSLFFLSALILHLCYISYFIN